MATSAFGDLSYIESHYPKSNASNNLISPDKIRLGRALSVSSGITGSTIEWPNPSWASFIMPYADTSFSVFEGTITIDFNEGTSYNEFKADALGMLSGQSVIFTDGSGSTELVLTSDFSASEGLFYNTLTATTSYSGTGFISSGGSAHKIAFTSETDRITVTTNNINIENEITSAPIFIGDIKVPIAACTFSGSTIYIDGTGITSIIADSAIETFESLNADIYGLKQIDIAGNEFTPKLSFSNIGVIPDNQVFSWTKPISGNEGIADWSQYIVNDGFIIKPSLSTSLASDTSKNMFVASILDGDNANTFGRYDLSSFLVPQYFADAWNYSIGTLEYDESPYSYSITAGSRNSRGFNIGDMVPGVLSANIGLAGKVTGNYSTSINGSGVFANTDTVYVGSHISPGINLYGSTDAISQKNISYNNRNVIARHTGSRSSYSETAVLQNYDILISQKTGTFYQGLYLARPNTGNPIRYFIDVTSYITTTVPGNNGIVKNSAIATVPVINTTAATIAQGAYQTVLSTGTFSGGTLTFTISSSTNTGTVGLNISSNAGSTVSGITADIQIRAIQTD